MGKKHLQDEGPEPHECSHSEIVSASNTVSDLLMHRKNSGTFLKVRHCRMAFASMCFLAELLLAHLRVLTRRPRDAHSAQGLPVA